ILISKYEALLETLQMQETIKIIIQLLKTLKENPNIKINGVNLVFVMNVSIVNICNGFLIINNQKSREAAYSISEALLEAMESIYPFYGMNNDEDLKISNNMVIMLAKLRVDKLFKNPQKY